MCAHTNSHTYAHTQNGYTERLYCPAVGGNVGSQRPWGGGGAADGAHFMRREEVGGRVGGGY
jgi:hypothetical protein